MNSKATLQKQLERYTARLERIIQRIRRTSRLYGNIRLTIFLAGLTLTYLTYLWFDETTAWAVFGFFFVAFVVVAFFHRRVINSLRRHEIWLHIKRTHLARMQLDWAQIPPSLASEKTNNHHVSNLYSCLILHY